MQSLVQAVFENSKLYPEKPAVIYNDSSISYSELADKISSFAFWLKSKKIKKGSRIIIEADNLTLYFCAFLGCQLYGCIAVPVEKNISIYKLQEILKSTKPALVFMKNNGEDYNDYLKPCKVDCDEKELTRIKPDAVCAIISTTGTTGKPSLVSQTNKSQLAAAQNLSCGTNITESTVLFTNIPFDLAAGYRRVMTTLYKGATAVITHDKADIGKISHFHDTYNINHLSLVSSDLSGFTSGKNAKTALKGINYIESAAGPLPSNTIKKFYQKFPDITLYNVYGTTESGCILINNTRDNYTEKCLGKPAVNAKICLIDENGRKINEPGKYGYVAVEGDMNMLGYYRKKELTEKVMNGGRLILNDIAFFDSDGYYYFVSRVGDIINVMGHKINPIDVENIASQFSGIKDCACSSRDDLRYGEIPILFVVYDDEKSFDTEKLKQYLEMNLESYRVPKSIIPVKKIPRTSTGKIMRKSLQMLEY